MSTTAENNLSTLNAALFTQLERLTSANGEAMNIEIERSKATSQIARDIIANAKLVLEAAEFRTEYGVQAKLPAMLAQDK